MTWTSERDAHARSARPKSRVAGDRWGRAAEAQIADRYAALGGRVVGRRVRTPAGELDLVIAFGDALVFVEVKARRSIETALAALQPRQIARLAAAAEHFLTQRSDPTPNVRFDVAAVGRDGRFEIVENAIVDGLA